MAYSCAAFDYRSWSAALIFSQRASVKASDDKTIIRGGGTTIIHGGTGPGGGFIPVLTTIAFHAERIGAP